MKLKKITALLMASVMAAGAATAVTASAAPNQGGVFAKVMKGDLYRDKKIDVKDLNALKTRLKTSKPVYNSTWETADVNWDRKIDSKDVKALELHVSGRKKIHTGDVNGNSLIEPSDYGDIMKYITGDKVLTATQRYAADVNGDGRVDIEDCVILRNYYFD